MLKTPSAELCLLGQEGLKELEDIYIHATMTGDVQDCILNKHSTCQPVNYKAPVMSGNIMRLPEQLYPADRLIKGLHC